jgi:hypothetical protein
VKGQLNNPAVGHSRKTSTKSHITHSAHSSHKSHDSGVLGKLHNDMEYLENLLNHPGMHMRYFTCVHFFAPSVIQA